MSENTTHLLSVKDLHTSFTTDHGEVQAVNGVSFNLDAGKVLGIVGESGSGKSVTAYSIMQILADNGRITSGEILYKGEDISRWGESKMQDFRGKCCSIIFQDPMTSLNPTQTVGDQILEVLNLHFPEMTRDEKNKRVDEMMTLVGIPPQRKKSFPHEFSGGMKQRVVIAMALVAEPELLHTKSSKHEAMEKALEMLKLVGINEPEKRLKQYPYELSGGMRQRVMIAMALACEPDILIADEPTTALDVTIQAQILELMQSLQKKLGMAIIMVTHDLGVIAEMCDEIVVMYGGRFCERGTADEIFYNPRHEYTRGLLRSIPNITNMKERLVPISGTPINMLNMPKGCAFCARCDKAMKICLEQVPEERIINESHRASCWINTRDNIGTVEEAE